MNHSIVHVPFDGDQLEVVLPDGEAPTRENLRVVIRRVCETLGVDLSSQLAKLKAAPWAGVAEITIPSAGGPQSTSTIPLKSLPMWLARLNPGKVAPELREKVIRYQCDAADALADAFLGRGAGARGAPSEAPGGFNVVEVEAIRGNPRAAALLLASKRFEAIGQTRAAQAAHARMLSVVTGDPMMQRLEPQAPPEPMHSARWIARNVFDLQGQRAIRGRESSLGTVAELLGYKTPAAVAEGLSMQVEGTIETSTRDGRQYNKPTLEWRYSARTIPVFRAAYAAQARLPKSWTWSKILVEAGLIASEGAAA